MYTDYFGLTEAPFSIAPNPHYLFMSQRHREALAHLKYGVMSDGGFILLTGEVGTGKTTLCRRLLGEMPSDVETAFVLNPRVSAIELLATICDEFGIAYSEPASIKTLVDRLLEYLLECHSQGQHTVLIIDEAQNLSRDLLEQIRLLTNLETNERKLLQIILLGQPELLDLLAQENLRQFSQRITARFHLDALNRVETREYISHRMTVAGGDPGAFSRRAMNRIFKLSAGVPRVINLICDRSLLGAYARDTHLVTPAMVDTAAGEVLGPRELRSPWPLALAGIFAVAASAAWYIQTSSEAVPVAISEAVSDISEPQQVLLGHDSKQSAWHDLFTLWGAAFEDRATPACELATNISLRCLQQRATINDLLSLNRPALIQIDQTFFVVSRIVSDKVTLIAGSNQYDLSLQDFREIYDGEVELLWRMPPAYNAPIQPEDSGAAVDWLVVQLSMLAGEQPPLAAGFVYDQQLQAQVRDFQSSVGLAPDGVVDPLTWIHLNNVEAINIPTLQQNHQG
jgi:general secretion pathway protein A